MIDNALIIFVKNLIAGRVKTRLAVTLGDEKALEIYNRLLKNIHEKIQFLEVEKLIFYSDFLEDDIWEKKVFKKEIQIGLDLGERMKNAFNKSFIEGYKRAIIIGTDCPGVDQIILKNAFAKLNDFDIVIGPATDGGYYLLGMKKEYSFLFQNIEWSTDVVLQQTIDLCKINQLSYFLLPELSDIDEEKDLIHFENHVVLKHKS